ncbi:MAG: alpha/beta hydrolase [Verrucomicrobiales bacterium]|jgi:pimeloyl-ACP methyl ester carboxylesterase|nr:alpha/beta hydrolase [Verrucomicrobiales bacterium]MBP9223415.1 alpha/beta hydrolase [Verrucomicrobiales bacterium]HQZ29157.1 alpha/beta hydrolase [Verrucomicrobiales bacterium]
MVESSPSSHAAPRDAQDSGHRTLADDQTRRGTWLAPLIPFPEAIAHLSASDFLEIDGQRVFVRSTGEGFPLLMIHGFIASHFSFRYLAPILETQFRVILIDLNGFGYTERPMESVAYGIETQADLLVRILETLGIQQAAILGHSYGAAVATFVAQRHPDRVSALILVSPASKFDRLPWYYSLRLGRELVYLLCRRLLSDSAKYREIAKRAVFVDGIMTEAVAETYRRQLLIGGLKSTFLGYVEALLGKGIPPVPFASVPHPVLLLAGEQDAVIPLAQCHEITEVLQNGTLVILSPCGHSAPEECPARVAKEVTSFFAGLDPLVLST